MPEWRQNSHEPMRPMSWYSGSQLTPTSVGPASSPAPIARMLARRFAWVRRTPLGWPVLPEVYWMKAGSEPAPSGSAETAPGIAQLVGGHHRVEGRHRRAQERGHRAGAGDGDQQAGPGVGEDPRLAGGVLLEAIQAHRGVDGDRDRPGDQDAEEGAEEVEPGGEHQGDGVSAADAALPQAAGHRRGLAVEPLVGDLRFVSVVLAEEDVGTPGSRRAWRHSDSWRVSTSRPMSAAAPGAVSGPRSGRRSGLAGPGLEDRPGEAGGGVDLEARVVEGAGEGLLQPGQELHALQAPEPDLPVEGGLRAHRPLRPGPAHLAGDRAHDPEHRVEDLVLVGSRGRGGIGRGGHRGHSIERRPGGATRPGALGS